MKKKISFAIFLFIIGTGVAGLVGWAAIKEAYRSKKIEQEIEALKRDAQRISQENSALEEKIAYFETPEFKERIAKEKLNMQKPDEQVVVVKPSVGSAQQKSVMEPVPVQEEKPELPNYQKWWEYFFKY